MERPPFFRAGVGAMIVNARGEILVLERVDVPGAWQMPQGGIEAGESPRDAVMREVAEETAIPARALSMVAEAPEWLAYELPASYRSRKTGLGQVQRWYLFRFTGVDDDIRPGHAEFRAWRWVTRSALLELAVEFRRPVYARLLTEFGAWLLASGAGGRAAGGGR